MKHPLHRIHDMAVASGLFPHDGITKLQLAEQIADTISMGNVDVATINPAELSIAQLVCANVHFRIPSLGDRTLLSYHLRAHLAGPTIDIDNPLSVSQALLENNLSILGDDKTRKARWKLFQMGEHPLNYENMEEHLLKQYADMYLLSTGGTRLHIEKQLCKHRNRAALSSSQQQQQDTNHTQFQNSSQETSNIAQQQHSSQEFDSSAAASFGLQAFNASLAGFQGSKTARGHVMREVDMGSRILQEQIERAGDTVDYRTAFFDLGVGALEKQAAVEEALNAERLHSASLARALEDSKTKHLQEISALNTNINANISSATTSHTTSSSASSAPVLPTSDALTSQQAVAFALACQNQAVAAFAAQLSTLTSSITKDADGKISTTTTTPSTTTTVESRYIVIIYNGHPISFGLLLQNAVLWIPLVGGPSRMYATMKMLHADIMACLRLLRAPSTFQEGEAKFITIIVEALELAGDDEQAQGIEDAKSCRTQQKGDFHSQYRQAATLLLAQSQLEGLGDRLFQASIYQMASNTFALSLDTDALKHIEKQYKLNTTINRIFDPGFKAPRLRRIEDSDDDDEVYEQRPPKRAGRGKGRGGGGGGAGLTAGGLGAAAGIVAGAAFAAGRGRGGGGGGGDLDKPTPRVPRHHIPSSKEIIGDLPGTWRKAKDKCSTCHTLSKYTCHEYFECPVAYKTLFNKNMPGWIADANNFTANKDPAAWSADLLNITAACKAEWRALQAQGFFTTSPHRDPSAVVPSFA